MEAVGLGMGKIFDKALNIGKHSPAVNKTLYKKRGVDEAVGRGILGNIFQVPTDVWIERLTEKPMQPIIIIEPLQYGGYEEVK